MTAASAATASIDLVAGLFLTDLLAAWATTAAFCCLAYSATSSSAFFALYAFISAS